ncbi:hypothetical protein V6N12_060142 [Hibiscus sabdariffa]|uniref:Reverse transcriptase zinc-binding domain-containing protein n=1 Tax=Hibiscus sabdariffa TaxID=183260 RepID=A0ABR2D4E5_9ROSI
MERLGHIIHNAVDNDLWCPFRIFRNGSPFSHLFFADHLILYAKADMNQANIIESILTVFGKFSAGALSNSWSDFLLAWSIGNGNSINVFSDIWIPMLGPPRQHLLDPSMASVNLSISDLVSAEGNWDLTVLQTLFTDSAIEHIIGIKCPDPLDGNDRCMWRWTPNHNFVLKSAYMNLVDSIWLPKQAIWKVIWRLNVPQRIRLFLWIAYQQKLMTNAVRHRRNLTVIPHCLNCSNQPETVLHALRDCADSRHCWMQITPSPILHSFSMNARNWISCNISASFLHPFFKLPWNLIFASFTWQLWKWRNDVVFSNDSQSDAALINRNIALAKHFNGSISPPAPLSLPLHTNASTWPPPSSGWHCLNVDGGIALGPRNGRIGGLVRNDKGD